MRRSPPKKPSFSRLAGLLESRLKPPFGIVLGSPGEVAELASALPAGDLTCFQMDLYQADRLREELLVQAEVVTGQDLWDLPQPMQTLIYPVPYGGERQLKIDMIEQGFHTLTPGGIFVVLSPYEKDDFFQAALKKVFGKVHAPAESHNQVFWCQRQKERSRRRHEVTFQVNGKELGPLRFLSRPGTFSFGHFDDGARALVECADVNPGDRIVDLGCGCGTNGIIAGLKAGENGKVLFVDSNVRALALAEHNAKEAKLPHFDLLASSTLMDIPERSFDLVLANPPYYAQLSIAKLFVDAARRSLRKRGRLFLVTKQPDTVGPMVGEVFGPTDAIERRGYIVLSTRV